MNCATHKILKTVTGDKFFRKIQFGKLKTYYTNENDCILGH